ncbi:MAG: hypothetical protein MZU97_25265 [Bacillus subtilis]|nr:hypothetical protein [Bacillus subtilis]
MTVLKQITDPYLNLFRGKLIAGSSRFWPDARLGLVRTVDELHGKTTILIETLAFPCVF